MQPVFLKVYHKKGNLVTSRQFTADQISIGSSPDGPSLVLADRSVCFWHALIERRGGEYYISDLGSPTGTFVDSKQILESPLKHGGKITVGDFVIHFFVGLPFVKTGAGGEVKTKPAKEVSTPLAKPPPPPPESSLLEDKEVRPDQTLTDIDIGPAISPLSKTFEKDEDTGVSALKKTEVIPPSASRDSGAVADPPDPPDPLDPLDPPDAPKSEVKDSPVKSLEPATAVSPVEPESPPPSPAVSPVEPESPPPSPAVSPVEPESPPPSPAVSPVEPESPPSPAVSPMESEYPLQSLEPVEPADPHSKGTYAPRSAVQDLDTHIPAGGGPVVEVTVAWKERVLSVNHFFKEDNKTVTFGSHPSSDIFCPNLTKRSNYKLLKTGQKTAIFLSSGVKAGLIDRKGHKHSFDKLVEKGLISSYGSRQTLTLNQNQLVRLDFSSSLRVYVRYSNRSQKALSSGLFDFNFSEMMGLMMSFFFMSMLFFYLALFSPQLLSTKEELEEEGIKKATIEFKKKPPRRVVKLKMGEKTRKTKISLPHKAPKKRKKVGIKKPGKQGRLGQVAAKPKEKSKKKTITSARPGGSVTTGKSGAGPKSPRPDPTKIGLLGVFGKKGTQQQLDKAYSGTGELAGLAEQATGYAGQKESYTGKGIGTQFKNTGAGGKGSALIGVSAGIKTRGRGGGVSGYGRGGSLGSRGRVQLQLGTSDWEVEGGVDKNAILRVIRRNKHQLEWCYEFALQKKPDLEGKVLVQWNIVNERVRNTKIRRNTTYDSALARCLMTRLKNFRFTGTGLKKGQIGEVSIPFVVTKK